MPTGSASVDEVRRLEAWGRRAWPAAEVADIEGWVVGSTGAYTRRANSAAAEAAPGDERLAERVAAVEAFYAERDRPVVFKLAGAAAPASLDALLAARGYAREGVSSTMTLEIAHTLAANDAPTKRARSAPIYDVWRDRLDSDWLEASWRLSSVPESLRAEHVGILERCRDQEEGVLFGAAVQDGEIVSVAAGGLVDDWVSLVLVATDPARRGEGIAESVLRGILYAARDQEADFALLSVEVDNPPARRLYERMGFVDRYRYAYRVSRSCAD